MEKKTYINPRLQLIVTQPRTHLLTTSGVDNSDQSDDGGVGAKPFDEDSYPQPFNPWED